jgi:folate-dependent phosphoribosylglycinamide formyltransferase PurN
VLASGATVSGATVHYVDEEYDHGPIIAQWPVPVHAGDTQKSLAARVLEVEHRLLPAVVTELARLGVPRQPVRLFAPGSAFVTGDSPAIALGG